MLCTSGLSMKSFCHNGPYGARRFGAYSIFKVTQPAEAHNDCAIDMSYVDFVFYVTSSSLQFKCFCV